MDIEFLPPPKTPDFAGMLRAMEDELFRAVGIPARLLSVLEPEIGNVLVEGNPMSDNARAIEIAGTIARQIGGGAFVMMGTPKGSKLAHNDGSLQFDIRGAKRGINRIIVRLTPADLYDIEFWKIPGMRGMLAGREPVKVSVSSGVYCDQLRPAIESETGLYLSL